MRSRADSKTNEGQGERGKQENMNEQEIARAQIKDRKTPRSLNYVELLRRDRRSFSASPIIVGFGPHPAPPPMRSCNSGAGVNHSSQGIVVT